MIEHLMKILRNTARVMKTDEKPILTVGIVGFPNVGKSSIINALRKSNPCVVSTSPGTTKSM
jgi:ribosome biogenesis GTPase A